MPSCNRRSADVNVVDQSSKATLGAMVLSYIGLFIGWYLAYYGGYYAQIEQYLYQYEIVITCSIYCLCELYYLFYLGHRDGLSWVVLAGTNSFIFGFVVFFDGV